MQYRSVFITGGAGYCGSRLVPQLLDKGYKVSVYDLMLFGNDFLPSEDPNLNIIKGDIRDIDTLSDASKNHDVFINLACISNDASFVFYVGYDGGLCSDSGGLYGCFKFLVYSRFFKTKRSSDFNCFWSGFLFGECRFN